MKQYLQGEEGGKRNEAWRTKLLYTAKPNKQKTNKKKTLQHQVIIFLNEGIIF